MLLFFVGFVRQSSSQDTNLLRFTSKSGWLLVFKSHSDILETITHCRVITTFSRMTLANNLKFRNAIRVIVFSHKSFSPSIVDSVFLLEYLKRINKSCNPIFANCAYDLICFQFQIRAVFALIKTSFVVSRRNVWEKNYTNGIPKLINAFVSCRSQQSSIFLSCSTYLGFSKQVHVPPSIHGSQISFV